MNERVNYENCDYNGKIELKKDLELWTQLQLLQQGNKVSEKYNCTGENKPLKQNDRIVT